MNKKLFFAFVAFFPATQGCAEVTGEVAGLGGEAATGGSSSGGFSSGGTSSGGARTGGSSSGGSSTGGGSSGGTSTGGTSTGGATTGGASTGGAATGGAATGGAGTGGTVSGCEDSKGITLKYKAENTSNTIGVQLLITNISGAPIDLSKLEARYYFTDEVTPGGGSLSFNNNWAFIRQPQTGITQTTSRTTLAPAVTGADSYVSVKYSGGTLANSQFIIHSFSLYKSAGTGDFNQSNDYSYDASRTGDIENGGSTYNKIVVLNDGVLAWGCAPE